MNGSHILLVDDDAALLQALPEALHLRMDPLRVDVADSATAALERIAQTDYDTIVSDIKMPGMDGLALLAYVRERWPTTPTLLITGHGEHDLALQALRGGAYDFIQKPIDRDYFVASLRRAIQMRQMQRQIEAQQRALEEHANHLEDLVQERTRELQAASAAREEFISIAAHELRTPLTSLKALVQMTFRRLERAGSKEAAHLLTMERSLRRMEMLVNDLVDTSRIEVGKLVLRQEQCDLVALCRQLVLEQTLGAERVVEFVAPDQPLPVLADSDRLSQVLANLLSNAMKYTPTETPITVTLAAREAEATVAVRDRGPGIPAEALPHIFERFYRVPGIEVQSGSGVGLGLGLYIAHEIVERHGGRIWVESDPQQGATFTVALRLCAEPIAVSDAPGAAGSLSQQANGAAR